MTQPIPKSTKAEAVEAVAEGMWIRMGQNATEPQDWPRWSEMPETSRLKSGVRTSAAEALAPAWPVLERR